MKRFFYFFLLLCALALAQPSHAQKDVEKKTVQQKENDALTHVQDKLNYFIAHQMTDSIVAWIRYGSHPNISASQFQKAVQHLLARANKHPELLYACYNALGTIHWYASRNDSAAYCFTQALQMLDKAPETPQNKYYRKALLKNNLAGIYRVNGNTTAAISAMQECIELCGTFLQISPAPPQKPDAQDLQFRAIENLGGVYKELGNYAKTEELLLYAYDLKKKARNHNLFISQILLGQLYYAKRNYPRAIELLEQGRKGVAALDSDQLFWHGDACYGLALVYDKLGAEDKAATLYTEAGKLYGTAFGDQFDFIYLEYMQNHALFLAENNRCAEAMAKSSKTLDYLVKAGESNSLQQVQQFLNMSEITARCGQHKAAVGYADNALSVIQLLLKKTGRALDSVQVEIRRPRALLMKAQSTYALLPVKNEAALSNLLNELQHAENVLERRKSVLYDEADQTLLLADQHELLQFIQQLLLELHEVSGKEKYLEELVSTHEANIYARIRSRMDSRNSQRFAFVPQRLLNQETQLKQSITAALQQENAMQAYLAATNRFEQFSRELKRSYPRYFSMRYGKTETDLTRLQKQIPPNTCFVKYIFNNDKLLVTTGDRTKTQFTLLDAKGIDSMMLALRANYANAAITGHLLHQLYLKIWAPIEKMVPHAAVIVLPDGPLYHLNFETLLRQPATQFNDFPQQMLLARQAFSYRYSLQQLMPLQHSALTSENYIAFVPGFREEPGLKRLLPETEKAYFSFLPLPFSDQLAKKMADKFEGSIFSGKSSTITNFKQKAGNHRIIHIGTHAEANNLFPEYSRLLFYPDTARHNDNSYTLYLSDIYECDLRSELTVLTACESGSAGYQDGEGMISLAHAFQYAGSNSMLTALWKIDEQSSVAITELFYANLAKGMRKDEALRRAKLSYLSGAKGRTLSPEYWAGLVLMGNTDPMNMPEDRRWLLWSVLLGGMVAIVLILLAFSRKKRARP